jgi:NiFe hydrogenase small subunit HydA
MDAASDSPESGARLPLASLGGQGQPVSAIDVLWITAGLGCDGDTIAMTAATQPSIEDVINGGIPWTPKVHLHNPFLAAANGDDFLLRFRQAAQGKVDPFILVVEGSIPDETNKAEGYWASLGTDPATGQPITTCEWIDRLAPHAWAVIAVGTCATYGGIHAMEGNPTGCMGLPDYLGWKWKSRGGLPIVCIPGCPVQPDNFMETLLYLLYMTQGRAPMIPLDEALRPTWLFGSTVHEGCDRGGYYEQAQFAAVHRQAGLLGPGRSVQRGQARLDGRHWRLPQRGRHLHRLHHAWVPRQVHALHEPAPGVSAFIGGGRDLRAGDPCAAQVYSGLAQ